MSHSSRGSHFHTTGKTLLFLSVLKFQPQEFPLEKQAPSPSRGQRKENSNENLFWTGLCALNRHKMQKESQRLLPTGPHLDLGNFQALSRQRGLGSAALPFSVLAPGGEGIPGHPQDPNEDPCPSHDSFGEEAAGRSFQSPEMQFSTPGKVTSLVRAQGSGRGRRVEEGQPCTQRGPRTASSPPLTLGLASIHLRLLPEKGAGPGPGSAQRGRNRAGDQRGAPGVGREKVQKKRLKRSRALPGNLHSNYPLLREPGPGAAPIHGTHTPNSKVAWMHEGKPPPLS